jgi:hypothetical protein
VGWIEAKQMGDADRGLLLALPSDFCRMPLIIPMIIQTIRRYPSGADQIDAEHPSRTRKVVGSNPTSGSKTAGQSIYTDLPSGVLLAFLIIPGASLALCGCAASTAFREELSHHPLGVLLMKHRMQSAHARLILAIRASDVGR